MPVIHRAFYDKEHEPFVQSAFYGEDGRCRVAFAKTMCTNPTRIRNPNRGYKKMKFADTETQFIEVPCGHCDECVKLRQLFFVQRVQMEALENHLFFASITYNNKMIPEIGTSTGHTIRFVDTHDIVNMFKRLRRHNAFGRPFRYVGVTEHGSKRGRPHVHILFFVPKYPGDTLPEMLELQDKMFKAVLKEWRRNVNGSRSRYAEYEQCCTYIRRFIRGKLRSTYDLHYVNPVLSDGQEGDVAFYVSKYMIKESKQLKRLQRGLRMNLEDDEYNDTWKKVKPRWFASPGFGTNAKFIKLNKYEPSKKVIDYIRYCIEYSKKEFDSPKFINPINGQTFPLGRYYVNRADCYTIEDQEFFWKKRLEKGQTREDNVTIKTRDTGQMLISIDNSRLKYESLEFDYDDYDELF